MTISVIIATYNRAALVEACLRQLERQAFQPGDGIVVADNGSTDATTHVVQAAAARMPGRVRLVSERRPGKSSAVAAAVETCRADVLAFTDDDVLVADDWLERIRQVMAEGAVALAGGPVLPLYERRVPDWLDLEDGTGFGRMAAPLGLLHYGDTAGPLGPRVVLGANVAVRRDAFLAVGGYAAHLGKLRGTLLSGEDHDLCERIQAAGYTAVYEPGIRVRHLVPADRTRLGYFLRWFYWSGVTHATLDADRVSGGGHRRLLGLPGHVVREFAEAGALTLGAGLRASWSAAAEQATRVAFSAGYLFAARNGRANGRAPSAGRRVEAA